MARKSNKMHDIMGFAPDVDPETPGACSDIYGVIPSTRGWRASPRLDRSALRMGTSVPVSAPQQVYHSLTQQVITKVGNQLIRNQYGGSSNTATGTLVLSTDLPCPFLDFGAYVLAGNPNNSSANSIANLSASTFVPIVGSPINSLLLVGASRFVLSFNTSDGWACSMRDNHASWTANPATLAAFGRLPGLPDDYNKTAVALGDDVLLFKGRTVYHGRFEEGNSEVWDFKRLSIDINANLCRSSATYKQGIVVLADDGLYYYDGSVLDNLMDGRMSRWYAKRALQSTYNNRVVVDEVRNLIWVSSLIYDDDDLITYSRKFLVCDPVAKRWAFWGGESLINIDEGAHFWPGHWFASYTPRTTLRTVWGIPFSDFVQREIGADTTAAAVARIVTNDIGSPDIDSELTRATLKLTTAPTGSSPTVTSLSRNTLDGTLSTASPVARSSDGHFDVRQNARWHRLQFDLTGDFEVTGFAVDPDPTGLR